LNYKDKQVNTHESFQPNFKKVQQTNRLFDLGRSATLDTLGQPVTQLNATEYFCDNIISPLYFLESNKSPVQTRHRVN